MTPVFSARRRAEQFDSLVEGASTTGGDARYAEFLEIVSALRAVPSPEARPEFVASLRGQLMAAAETELVAARVDERLLLPTRRPRERRLAAAVGGLAVVGATTSMALAAQSALPGDLLYPLKRAIENVETGISVDEGERGATLLANAEGRLDEVTALSRDGQVEDPALVEDTLNSFTDQTIEASDYLISDYESSGEEAPIDQLRTFISDSMATLVALEPVVPVDAQDELVRAARVLDQIDTQARELCPDCAGPEIVKLPKIFFSAAETERATRILPQADKAAPAKGDDAREGEKTTPPATEADGQSSLPGGVLEPPEDDGDDETGGPKDAPADNPIGDLTQGLTGGGTTTQDDGGAPALPDADDTVDEVVEGLVEPLLGQD